MRVSEITGQQPGSNVDDTLAIGLPASNETSWEHLLTYYRQTKVGAMISYCPTT